MKPSVAVLAVALLAAVGGGLSTRHKRREPRPMSDAETFQVVEDAGEQGLSNVLTVSAGGQIDYLTDSNSTRRERAEIGRYHATVDPGALSGLWALVSSPAFAAMEDHFGKLAVGSASRRLLYTKADVHVQKMVGPSLPPPKGLAPVEAEFARLIEIALKAPVRVMRVDVSWPKSPASRGAREPLTVVLANAGTRPLEYASPFARNGIEQPVLVIRAERSDVPLLAMRSHHVVTQPVGRADVKSTRPSLDPGRPTATLAVGANQVLDLSVQLDWPPGEYRVALVWSDPVRSRDESRLSGELHSPSATLRITGPTKPGDEGAPPAPDDDE